MGFRHVPATGPPNTATLTPTTQTGQPKSRISEFSHSRTAAKPENRLI